ncbi:MAG TPA: hypothetical protein VK002_04065 [Rubricoccaceae bacterium]|nr:hypothetical protein [Rubricoccaceae bacterium]
MSRRAALGLTGLLLLGCREAAEHRKLPPPFAGSTPATALDTLAGERPVEVSVGGHVAEPPAGRLLLLDDGTGIAYVVLPDTIAAAPPVPVGTRFLAQGLLRRIDGLPVVEAEAWYYDSTAVPVRSP